MLIFHGFFQLKTNKQATGLDVSSETWTHDDWAHCARSPLFHPPMEWGQGGVTKCGGVAE